MITSIFYSILLCVHWTLLLLYFHIPSHITFIVWFCNYIKTHGIKCLIMMLWFGFEMFPVMFYFSFVYQMHFTNMFKKLVANPIFEKVSCHFSSPVFPSYHIFFIFTHNLLVPCRETVMQSPTSIHLSISSCITLFNTIHISIYNLPRIYYFALLMLCCSHKICFITKCSAWSFFFGRFQRMLMHLFHAFSIFHIFLIYLSFSYSSIIF